MLHLCHYVIEMQQAIAKRKRNRQGRLRQNEFELKNNIEAQSRDLEQKRNQISQLETKRAGLESKLKELKENETKEYAANDLATQNKQKLVLENQDCDKEINELNRNLEKYNEINGKLQDNLASLKQESRSGEEQYNKQEAQYKSDKVELEKLNSATELCRARLTKAQSAFLHCLAELTEPVDAYSQGTGDQKKPRNS